MSCRINSNFVVELTGGFRGRSAQTSLAEKEPLHLLGAIDMGDELDGVCGSSN